MIQTLMFTMCLLKVAQNVRPAIILKIQNKLWNSLNKYI